ncbi:MAG: ubiquinol-cytochrome c reductase iron-sulfur subunit [Ktedonobacteraceae bacterium]|nr:ubiquinol-cytochrome c reductase iron-sulfur subunit [Ktedonobacteraceae bacterium]MBO0793534.1 ubiquinol-cytochrome c reductase iron-sulfur subunit [Ktedonobacteraceae bacterium]
MDTIEKPGITPQQYEVLHGGGAEAAELAKQRLSRRRFLRRSMLAVWGVSTVASVAGALDFLYPTLSGQFGATLAVGKKSEFPAANPGQSNALKLDQAAVFHKPTARAYIIHLSKDTEFALKGSALPEEMQIQNVVKDSDGSYWIALYQKCVHLGCTVPFRDDCASFKCPCHGSHYNIDGGFLDGPAPRSLDRFQISFQGDDVMVNTGVINDRIQHPDATTRLIAQPTVQCSAGGGGASA